MNNLFISYQLDEAEKNLEQVDKAIASLGNSTKLHNGCWYVNSPENVDASNNETTWFNLEDKRAQRVRQNWKM